MTKEIKGLFTQIDGQSVYKIENYDQMENFFMTITSSSDNWNFCWSWGGLTAGRIDSNHAVFPYYTADKVSDAAPYTGNYTCICVEKSEPVYWEPFTSLHNSPAIRKQVEKNIQRNIYKNYNGTQVWFEEINNELKLSFITSWTSSDKYGIVRKSIIKNLGNEQVRLSILDGCQNILPACCTSDFQNNNSILLDAYKKTDLDEATNLAIFSVSSVVSDKAEPNEGLYANVSWFSVDKKVILDTAAPAAFAEGKEPEYKTVSKGQRSSCFVKLDYELEGEGCKEWYQVFDTALTLSGIKELQKQLADRNTLTANLVADIKNGNDVMTEFLKQADGVQDSADLMACLHHQQNVMFNIMRGGILANQGMIQGADFVDFVSQRNTAVLPVAKKLLADAASVMNYEELTVLVEKENNPQLSRLFLEYIPLTFSRRHGDPSRPWNAFNIKLKNSNNEPILNYEGNWRDIFQNWEALAWSYPMYIKNMCAKFLNAMTIDGFNPYKINRKGIDWEIPDPTNPWAQFGYWGDHQVIYFEKLLEFYEKTNSSELMKSLDEKIYTSANVPYRLKSYGEIEENPRSTILFDAELNKKLARESEVKGSDAKLVQDGNGNPALVSFTAKVLQIVISKAANLVPGGGIWLNTQRPEWNDANNALAGYGLSVVTACYLYRYLNFLEKLYGNTNLKNVTLPEAIYKCFVELGDLYKESIPSLVSMNSKERKLFVQKAGMIYEEERKTLYRKGYIGNEVSIGTVKVQEIISEFKKHVEYTIKMNKREDNLYHSYNTLKITEQGMEVEYLQEMLEGQVAVLSADLLSFDEVEKLLAALENSKMYEPRQKSFMLYPNKELPEFCNKNNVLPEDAKKLESLAVRTGTTYLEKDGEGIYHFNPDFRNANVIKDFIKKQSEELKPTAEEQKDLLEAYERIFDHQSFTGRSGTFYAYEGLGSIYWHMVSKLLLAVQENLFKAYREENASTAVLLSKAYYKIRDGLSYKKTPELYGAFPQDPYSHTPYGQGAKQPGMTGQVKEEILTRWGELGLFIEKGKVSFNPILLQTAEVKADGTLCFGWCGIPVTYKFTKDKETYITVGAEWRKGNELTESETKDIFMRNGKIKNIEISFSSAYQTN